MSCAPVNWNGTSVWFSNAGEAAKDAARKRLVPVNMQSIDTERGQRNCLKPGRHTSVPRGNQSLAAPSPETARRRRSLLLQPQRPRLYEPPVVPPKKLKSASWGPVVGDPGLVASTRSHQLPGAAILESL